MRVGDKVMVVVDHPPFFRVGDMALITDIDEVGDVWADFSGNDRVEDDGIWCINPLFEDRDRFFAVAIDGGDPEEVLP